VANSPEEEARRSKTKSGPRWKTAPARVVLERDRWVVWCCNALMVTTHLINGHSAPESSRGDRAGGGAHDQLHISRVEPSLDLQRRESPHNPGEAEDTATTQHQRAARA
jgi:hypothetical protein